MTTTHLFAELLVIGIGVAIWLTLLIAGLLGHPLPRELPDLGGALLVPLLGTAYVLGIVVDRLAYSLLGPLDRRSAAVVLAGLPDRAEVARAVLAHSDRLALEVDYNRSRLRICRSWSLNFALIGLSLLFWNGRAGAFPTARALAGAGVAFLFCVLCTAVFYALSRDYYKNLRSSYEFLTERS